MFDANNPEKIFTVKKSVREGDPLVLIDFLEKYTGLSKSTLKKVLNNGGVWLRKFNNQKRVRVRRATTEINSESHIEFFYDPKVINAPVVDAREIFHHKNFGVWYKPQGLLSQGTEYGDHCSILRQVEKKYPKVFLVHRLDREAHGLMVFAYDHKIAAELQVQWEKNFVKKYYKVEVLGNIQKRYPKGGEVTSKLDGKPAHTTFEILEQKEDSAVLRVQIHTGRLHQIRRHMEEIGFPVMGDPKYGRGNKNAEGLKLLAYELSFNDPHTRKEMSFKLGDDVAF